MNTSRCCYLIVNNGPSEQGLVYAKGSFVRHAKHEVRVRPRSKTGLHFAWRALDVLEALRPNGYRQAQHYLIEGLYAQ